MKLYHGSNVIIDEIDFSKCHPFKDFGRGFYLTDNFKHAKNMAYRRYMRAGGEECVTEFEFDYEGAKDQLNIKIFEKPDEEWAEFVMRNRSEEIIYPAHDFDIVIGPIADDAVVSSFQLYRDGFITLSELVHRLEYKELSIQYFFHNEISIRFLRKI